MSRLFLLLFCLQQVQISSHARPSADLSANLRQSVHRYHLAASNFVDALTQIATSFKLPMGIQWIRTPNAETPIRLSFEDSSVERILQEVIKRDPGTTMVVESNIIHVTQPDAIPNRENPLGIKIARFEVHNVTAEAASLQLQDLIERSVASTTAPRQESERRGGVAGSGFSNVDDPKISLGLDDSTLERVLDAIALKSVRKVWVVTFAANSTLTPLGYRRTAGLWTQVTAPDEDQPVWQWGTAPRTVGTLTGYTHTNAVSMNGVVNPPNSFAVGARVNP